MELPPPDTFKLNEMIRLISHSKISLIAAFSMLASSFVSAQIESDRSIAEPPTHEHSRALPIWNNRNGQLEAILLIENQTDLSLHDDADLFPGLGLATRWQMHSGKSLGLHIQTLGEQPQLGLICDHQARHALANCTLTQWKVGLSPGARIQASILGSSTGLTASFLNQELRLNAHSNNLDLLGSSLLDPSLLMNLDRDTAIEQSEFGLVGNMRIGQQGWVRLGSSYTRARLIAPNQIFGDGILPPTWDTSKLRLSAGHGQFGGELIGQQIYTPGQNNSYSSFDLGLTWRTPWRGRLSVGASNVLTSGENPFLTDPLDPDKEVGRVPYVRYQQDL